MWFRNWSIADVLSSGAVHIEIGQIVRSLDLDVSSIRSFPKVGSERPSSIEKGQTRSWPLPDVLTPTVLVVVVALAAVAEGDAVANAGAVISVVWLKQPPRRSAMSASFPPLKQPRGGFGSEFSTVPVPELKTAAFVKLSEQLEKLVPVGTDTFTCFAYCYVMPVSE